MGALERQMKLSRDRFVRSAKRNSLFTTVRHIDLIMCAPRTGLEPVARSDDTEVRSAIESEWEHLGVRDGVVRVFW